MGVDGRSAAPTFEHGAQPPADRKVGVRDEGVHAVESEDPAALLRGGERRRKRRQRPETTPETHAQIITGYRKGTRPAPAA